MSTSSVFLLICIGLFTIIYGDTHICDGSCGSTVNCIANELCLVQCTGNDNCRDITINCPLNGDCIVECYTSATDGGCRDSIIYASQSLSLLVNNSNSNTKSFQGVDVYCPYNSSCSLISDNNAGSAFKNAQIYSIFGFIWKQFSVSCNGNNCDQTMVMNCGHQYTLSSCTIDGNTGNSCDGVEGVCDTIYTSISGTWTDDYQINPAPGWIVTDYNGNTINSTYAGTLGTYHGPYYGDAVGSDLEIYTLIRYFYCSYTAAVFVKYYYGFGCQENTDYSRLYLNNMLKADKHAQPATGEDFFDAALENEVKATTSNYCDDAWNKKTLNGSLDEMPANTLFKVQIDIALNWQYEASVVNLLEITCIAPTNSPTMAGVTSKPTTNPTTLQPTYAPITTKPTSSPTAPTTSSPTVDPTARPTLQPTMDTSIPTGIPTVTPTRASSMNPAQKLSLRPTQKLQTQSTEQVDAEGLIVALMIIGTLFIITVIISCRLWVKHEKAHRPMYFKRTQLMLKEMRENNTKFNEAQTEQHVQALEMGEMEIKTGNAGAIHYETQID